MSWHETLTRQEAFIHSPQTTDQSTCYHRPTPTHHAWRVRDIWEYLTSTYPERLGGAVQGFWDGLGGKYQLQKYRLRAQGFHLDNGDCEIGWLWTRCIFPLLTCLEWALLGLAAICLFDQSPRTLIEYGVAEGVLRRRCRLRAGGGWNWGQNRVHQTRASQSGVKCPNKAFISIPKPAVRVYTS